MLFIKLLPSCSLCCFGDPVETSRGLLLLFYLLSISPACPPHNKPPPFLLCLHKCAFLPCHCAPLGIFPSGKCYQLQDVSFHLVSLLKVFSLATTLPFSSQLRPLNQTSFVVFILLVFVSQLCVYLLLCVFFLFLDNDAFSNSFKMCF